MYGRLSESLAGVTLLGFGNGAPDVFSTFAAMNANTGLKSTFGTILDDSGFPIQPDSNLENRRSSLDHDQPNPPPSFHSETRPQLSPTQIIPSPNFHQSFPTIQNSNEPLKSLLGAIKFREFINSLTRKSSYSPNRISADLTPSASHSPSQARHQR
ncbi:hypothetical protein O181_038269 [Austropuccinia psidii MF-1]|uniref:Uncharacterized protein n=1 Tax=Austropuccinia psidii MF-1 TaxID=1389203 RepID=A0A9Q3D851_9BASI|nr:hypothetical protein [Austropuccinia psidii MF-1]